MPDTIDPDLSARIAAATDPAHVAEIFADPRYRRLDYATRRDIRTAMETRLAPKSAAAKARLASGWSPR